VPHTLDLIVQPRLAPARSLAADRALLAEVRAPGAGHAGVLRVYDLAGDVVSLGRYHVAPEGGRARAGVELWRRHSGGRAMPWGEGFVGVSLVLPHRSALFAPDPLALAPAQVLNRHVRGILGACELAGAPAFYPGRDVVTVDRRVVALVSFEVDAGGALLFEAVIAVGRPFGVLPGLLDRADPGGVVPARMLTADDTTCLASALGREPATDEVAGWLRAGWERRLGVAFAARETVPEAPFDVEGWFRARSPRADLERHGTVETQLGVLDVRFALEAGRIRQLVLSGDVIANSPAIERLERDLRGCPAEPAAVEAVVARVFAAPENFVLGVGPPATIARAIARGLAA
jgi:hypothetical protein